VKADEAPFDTIGGFIGMQARQVKGIFSHSQENPQRFT
jgi:hypothetical protein